MKLDRRSFFGAATVACAGFAHVAKPRRRPNILLLLADDTTYDLLGSYGGKV